MARYSLRPPRVSNNRCGSPAAERWRIAAYVFKASGRRDTSYAVEIAAIGALKETVV